MGKIHSFESLGTVDGPGIRFVAFLQGCPLRCLYCHNPDTWEGEGKAVSSEEIVRKVLQYKNYYTGGGGVTLSGGEPLLQLDFCIEILRECKKKGVHTAIDTSGACFDERWKEKYEELLSVCDLFLLDIKHIDSEKHKALTGKGNERTLAFARFLDEHRHPMWIRYVLVPGYTDKEEDLQNLHAFIQGLASVEKIEVLPYHTLGKFKYEQLGKSYPLEGVEPPDKEMVERAKRILGIVKK